MWHHLMVTWEQESGRTKLYFDGRAQSAIWVRVLMTVAPLHTGNSFLGTMPCQKLWLTRSCSNLQVATAGLMEVRDSHIGSPVHLAAGTTRAPTGTRACMLVYIWAAFWQYTI